MFLNASSFSRIKMAKSHHLSSFLMSITTCCTRQRSNDRDQTREALAWSNCYGIQDWFSSRQSLLSSRESRWWRQPQHWLQAETTIICLMFVTWLHPRMKRNSETLKLRRLYVQLLVCAKLCRHESNHITKGDVESKCTSQNYVYVTRTGNGEGDIMHS